MGEATINHLLPVTTARTDGPSGTGRGRRLHTEFNDHMRQVGASSAADSRPRRSPDQRSANEAHARHDDPPQIDKPDRNRVEPAAVKRGPIADDPVASIDDKYPASQDASEDQPHDDASDDVVSVDVVSPGAANTMEVGLPDEAASGVGEVVATIETIATAEQSNQPDSKSGVVTTLAENPGVSANAVHTTVDGQHVAALDVQESPTGNVDERALIDPTRLASTELQNPQIREAASDRATLAATDVATAAPVETVGQTALQESIDLRQQASGNIEQTSEGNKEAAEATSRQEAPSTEMTSIEDGGQTSLVQSESLSNGIQQSKASIADTAVVTAAAMSEVTRREAQDEPSSSTKRDATPSEGLVSSLNRLQRSTTAFSEHGGEGEMPRVDATRFVSRVAKAFHAAHDRGGPLQLRLSPPELGSLRIELRVKEGALTAAVETESASAKKVLLDHLPALRERLAEQNIRIERFDVDVRREGGGQQNTGPHDQPHDRQQSDDSGPARRSSGPLTTAQRSTSGPHAIQSLASDAGLNLIV
jgi:flagellar hook-length control protein FliK